VDPSTSNVHQQHHRPLQLTGPRAEVIEILAGAVFALIAQGRLSSSRIATQRIEVIP
jgi:hypothetical protein